MRVVVVIGACAATASAAVDGSRFNAWHWLPWLVGLTAIIVFTGIAMAISGDLPFGGGRGSALRAYGRGDDGPVAMVSYRWRMLVVVSRMMPGPAGRRWLAEAESLLSEIAPARRGAAIRSYVLSAPRLVLMMWVQEVMRRIRPGPRRPG
ncbi:MAG: hypothetical protein ACRDOU_24905 [Streptosporangiaceae bacterium]